MKLQTVEAFLIEPLKAYFEKEPKVGFEAHIVEKLEGTDAKTLTDAVDWIKSNRQSQGSFPSPKECFAAVDAVRQKAVQAAYVSTVGNASGTYGERVTRWAKEMKRAEVVRKGSREWREWLVYYAATGNRQFLDIMLEGRNSWTVPCLIPSAFDANYNWNYGDEIIRKMEVKDDKGNGGTVGSGKDGEGRLYSQGARSLGGALSAAEGMADGIDGGQDNGRGWS